VIPRPFAIAILLAVVAETEEELIEEMKQTYAGQFDSGSYGQ
jgi:hypothetical protein